MAPRKDFVVPPEHSLVICRPTDIGAYRPLHAPPSEAQLRLQEALDGWVGPAGQSLHEDEWPLQHTPVMTFDAALAAEQRSSQTAADAVTAAAAATSGSSSSSIREPLLPGTSWSSSISQVELLRQGVAACCYSDGQPSMEGVACGAAGPGTQLTSSPTSNNIVPVPQLAGSAASNNIVPVPQLGSVHVANVRELLPSLAGVAPGGERVSSSAGGTGPAPAGTAARAAMLSATSTASSTSTGSKAMHLEAQQGMLDRAAAHPFCMEPAGSLGTGSAAADGNRGLSAAQHAASGRTLGVRSSSASGGHHAALRTTDWPVLSGANEHAAKPLWPLPRYSNRPALKRKPRSAVVGEFTAGGAGAGMQSKLLPTFHKPGNQAGVLNDAAVLVPPEYYAVDDKPVSVCVLGWGPNSLMASLIKELDHGLSALPKGSEVTFVNTHNPHESLGQALQDITLENVQVRHVAANPLQRSSLAAALDVSAFRCAVVLCDELWVDPDNNDANGLDSLDEPSVLRLDSLVMVAQLNIRKLLEDSRLPAINIICQKVATEGLTRFEDRHRLPFGVSVNLNSYAAKLLAQIAANPLMLVPVTRLGEDAMLTIADSSDYAALGEELNFWQLMARFQVTGDVLLGYYEIPEQVDVPLNTVVNPSGEERNVKRVWNKGNKHLQFILLCHKQQRHGSTSGSHDDMELESTKQATWVAARERSPHASLHTISHPNSFTDAQ